MHFINFFEQVYNEFLSYFVPDKLSYRLEGECKMCGKCCRYIYSYGTKSEKEFKFMQFIYPPYRRFKIVGKDEESNFIFACTLLGEDNKCTVYDNRPRVCRNYPVKKLSFYGKLHDGCGYSVTPPQKFQDVLSSQGNCTTKIDHN